MLKHTECLDQLKKLLPVQFEEVIFRLDVPAGILTGAPAPPSSRAIELIRWTEGRFNHLQPLADALAAVVSPDTDNPPAAVPPRQTAALIYAKPIDCNELERIQQIAEAAQLTLEQVKAACAIARQANIPDYQRAQYFEQKLHKTQDFADALSEFIARYQDNSQVSATALAALHQALHSYTQADYLQSEQGVNRAAAQTQPNNPAATAELLLLNSQLSALQDYAQSEQRYYQQAKAVMDLFTELDESFDLIQADYQEKEGMRFVRKGEYALSIPFLRRALDLRQRSLGTSHPAVARSLNDLAFAYHQAGEFAQALPLFQRALAIRKTVLGEQHPDYASSLNNLAALYESQGQLAQALPLFQRASEIFKTVLGEQHPDYASSLNNLAALYESQGEFAQALPLYQRASEIFKTVLGEQHPDYASSLNNLAGLYEAQGQLAQALPLFQQALAIRKTVLGEQHPDYATSLNNLAALYESQGEFAQALPLFQQASEIFKTVLGEQHPHTQTVLRNYQIAQDELAAQQAKAASVSEITVTYDPRQFANVCDASAAYAQFQAQHGTAAPPAAAPPAPADAPAPPKPASFWQRLWRRRG